MTSLPDRLLSQDRFYIPWNAERPTHTIGVPLARRLHEAHGKPVTIVCPHAANAPARAVAMNVVTERDGTVTDGGIVLAYCPSHRLARKFVHLDHSIIVVVEWHSASYLGWAKLSHAYNVVTGESHTDGLSADGLRAVENIIACGDLGWTDAPARSTVYSGLDRLTLLDELSPDVILAQARHRWGTAHVPALNQLMADHARTGRSRKHLPPSSHQESPPLLR